MTLFEANSLQEGQWMFELTCSASTYTCCIHATCSLKIHILWDLCQDPGFEILSFYNDFDYVSLLFSSSHCVPVLPPSLRCVVSAHHPLEFSSFLSFMVCFPCAFIDLYFAFVCTMFNLFCCYFVFLSFWLIFCNHFNSLDYDSNILGQIRGLYSLMSDDIDSHDYALHFSPCTRISILGW